MARVPLRLAQHVAARAGQRCEYCHAPRAITAQAFHADHIVPVARGGATSLDNLCYACPHCNLHKQERVEALDPRTQRLVRLFNPRQDIWEEHFRWGAQYRRLMGRTVVGRATVALLNLNSPLFQLARAMWAHLDLLP